MTGGTNLESLGKRLIFSSSSPQKAGPLGFVKFNENLHTTIPARRTGIRADCYWILQICGRQLIRNSQQGDTESVQTVLCMI